MPGDAYGTHTHHDRVFCRLERHEICSYLEHAFDVTGKVRILATSHLQTVGSIQIKCSISSHMMPRL